eukprot:TRINITY_DN2684_c1_g1_i3.p1 TRINITY_DN2684_c1_g1~~TRINITY_DN2684_c1_g1_i3.p1  ORF type:complete len:1125 (+),score=386.18 TRINITY_DN2684_c1_g1_i3:122-3496(+)
MERIVEIGVKFGKRKQRFRIHYDLRYPSDLQKIIKQSLKLQIPKDLLVIKHESTQKVLDPKKEQEFRETCVKNDLLEVSIKPFSVGANYTCSPEELGNGAFSQVYKGYHNTTKEIVAIKVVDAKLLDSDKTREYHVRERKILSALNHPNIVNLKDMVQQEIPGDGIYYYFVMEFCNGGSLDSFIHGHQLNENQVRRMMNQLASAFKCLTENKIVHRDLKPQNILLTSSNIDEATLKLCDFGFSRYFRSEEDQSTIQESLIRSYPNTPLYAAPDLLQRRPYDAKCDLWSIGVIMYEMLAGTNLFQVKTMAELEQAVLSRDSTISLPKGVHVSANCMDLLQRLLERDANKRVEWYQFFNHPFLTGKSQRIINCIPLAEQYGVEVDDHTNVGTVKAALERQISVRIQHQMLLTENGIEMNDDDLLNSSSDKVPLYLFNRDPNDSASNRPLDCQPIPVELRKDAFYVTLEEKPIEQILKVQHQCNLLLHNIREYLKQSELIVKKHEGLLPRLHIHSKGLKVGIDHLDFKIKQVQAQWNSVNQIYLNSAKQTDRILASFEECLEQMSSMSLHPSLRIDGNSNSRKERKTLKDCIDYNKVFSDFSRFKKIHNDLAALSSINEVLTAVSNSKPAVFLESSENHSSLKKSKAHRLEISAVEEYLEKKNAFVSKEAQLAKDKLSRKENIPAVSQNLDNCDSNLGIAAKIFDQMNTYLIRCIQAGNTVQQRLSVVGNLAEKLREISSNLIQLESKIIEQQQLVQEFDEILRLPEAYTSYISEMNRRRSFQVETQLQVEKFKSYFLEKEEDEKSRLSVFVSRYQDVLPKEIFPGLELRSQGHVEIQLESFPTVPIAVNPQSVEAMTDEFVSILDQGVNVAELRRENSLMRSEILSLLQKDKEKVSPTELLSENAKFRENSEKFKKKLEDLRIEYEQRFQKQKEHLRELEEARDFSKLKKDMDGNSKIIQLENSFRAEKATRFHLEKELKKEISEKSQMESQNNQIQQKLRSELEQAKSNAKNVESSLRSLMGECQDLKDQKKKMQQQLDEVNDSIVRQKKKIDQQEKEMERMRSEAPLAGQHLATSELDRVRDLLKAEKEKNDKLMASSNLRECPFCMQYFPEKEIETHVNTKHA